jgi:putative OPT family oligopeptide transporter
MIPAFIIAPTMQLLQNAYGIGESVREGVEPLKAPQGVMFEKLVGGIFGEHTDLPWDLVGYGALVGAAAILIDRFFLQPLDAKFRLHAMPLAVGMYLPWTVTFPILLGGVLYYFVERRSRARGDSSTTRQAVIHRGLLFSSGLVAGEAIMGILIALLVMARLDMPLLAQRAERFDVGWLKTWVEGGWPVDLVSLLALGGVMWLLARKALRTGGDAAS